MSRSDKKKQETKKIKNEELKKKNKKVNEEENEKTKRYKTKEDKKTKKAKNKKEKPKKEKIKKKHKILKRVILTIFILGLLIALIGAGIIAGIFFSDKFKLTEEDLKITNMNGVVLDKNGQQIGVLSGDENRKIVTFEDMPVYVPKAFIAIEDKRFYDHVGVDIKRTAYATIMYILNKGDADAGGGSTITQQLVKNLMNDMDNEGTKGVERKIREMARAYNVEKILSKDQILELYLNKIFMGSTVYGVGKASEYYFNKPIADVSLAEAAFLAGINHTPNSYNPFGEKDNSEIIKKRTKEVLFQMKDQGYIETEEEYNVAVQEVENGLAFSQGSLNTKVAYSYHTVDAIKAAVADIMREKDVDEDTAKMMIYNKGYTIYTTQDTTIQDRMEEEFLKDKYIKSGRKKDKEGNLINNHTQAAMVIIDHKTGQVVATVGGLGADSTSIGLNRATQSTKQTGSSIKPLACIAPALEKGIITAGTAYYDEKTSFGSYAPHNSSYSFSGILTIRQALAESSNVVHVKVMREVGPENSIKFMEKMGLKIDTKHAAPSLALGTADVSPLDMAAAYATIANNGEYITPIFYTKVVDAKGNVVVESKQEKTRAMSEANAYVLQNLLKSPAQSGTARVCYMSNMDVGAKTGSTDNYIDRWLCGFTPYYTAATWFGFDHSENPVFYNVNHAANIWAAVMKDVHKGLATARFKRPSNVVYVKICKESGCVATDDCTETLSEVFVKGTIPGKCEAHTKFKICKETGKIATDYCKDVEEKIYVTEKPAKENTSLWKTTLDEKNEKYKIPEETCDVHKVEEVEMINVVGKKLDEAKKELEALGLKVEIKYEKNKDKAENIVLKQSVKEKEKVEKGKTITLTINKLKDEGNGKNEISTNEIVDTTTNEIIDTTVNEEVSVTTNEEVSTSTNEVNE